MFNLFDFENSEKTLEKICDKELIAFLGLTNTPSKRFLRDSIICSQDDKIDNIYLIVRGQVTICMYSSNGKRLEKATLEAPLWIGEVEYLSQKSTYHNSVEALGEVLAYPISLEAYQSCFDKHPTFSKEVAYRLANLLKRNIDGSIGTLAYKNEAILLNYFITLLKENKETEEFCLLKQTRLKLSEKTGISQRTLNRLLAYFQTKNLISIRRGKICLKQDNYTKMIQRLEEL